MRKTRGARRLNERLGFKLERLFEILVPAIRVEPFER